jgi:hypothetical protein
MTSISRLLNFRIGTSSLDAAICEALEELSGSKREN